MDYFHKQAVTKYVGVREYPPENYNIIKDRPGTVYAPPDLLKTEKGGSIPSIIGHYYADKDTAAVINNFMSKSLMQYKGFRAAMGLANSVTMTQLGFSSFHAFKIFWEAMAHVMGKGVNELVHGHPLKGLGTIAMTVPNAIGNAATGKQMQKEWKVPGTYPDLADIVDTYAWGGNRGKQQRYLQTGLIERIKDLYEGGKPAAAFIRSFLAAPEAVMIPIFRYLVPWFKMGTFADQLDYEMRIQNYNNKTDFEKQKTAFKIGREMDYTMGQVVWDKKIGDFKDFFNF